MKYTKVFILTLLGVILLCGCFSLPSSLDLPDNSDGDKMTPTGKFDIQGSMSYKLFAMCRNFFVLTILITWVGSAYIGGWFSQLNKLWISAFVCLVITALYLLLSKNNGWDVIFMGGLSWLVQMFIYMKMRKKINA